MGAISESVRMWSVMNSGPVAQFRPMDSRSTWEIGGTEGIGGLAGEHGAHGLDGAGNHDRDAAAELAHQLLNAEQAGLDVARILAGLEQQNVGAAFHQGLGLLVKILSKLLERDAAGDGDGLVVGPMEPATKRGLAGVENSSAAWRASLAATAFSSWA